MSKPCYLCGHTNLRCQHCAEEMMAPLLEKLALHDASQKKTLTGIVAFLNGRAEEWRKVEAQAIAAGSKPEEEVFGNLQAECASLAYLIAEQFVKPVFGGKLPCCERDSNNDGNCDKHPVFGGCGRKRCRAISKQVNDDYCPACLLILHQREAKS